MSAPTRYETVVVKDYEIGPGAWLNARVERECQPHDDHEGPYYEVAAVFWKEAEIEITGEDGMFFSGFLGAYKGPYRKDVEEIVKERGWHGSSED